MIVSESAARDLLRLVVWYPGRWLISALPPRYAVGLLRCMGSLYYHAASGKKTLLRENMRAQLSTMSAQSLEEAIKEYFRNHFVKQLQIFFFPKLTARNIESIHSFVGREHLDAALLEGRGCVLVHPHFGPTQMPLHILGLMGYRPVQIGYLDDEGLSFIGRHVAFRLRKHLEAKIDATIVQATTVLKPVFAGLKNNAVVLIAGDGVGGGQKFIGRNTPMRFLETTYLFPMGPAALAAKTSAPLLPMFTVLHDGKYQTIMYPPTHVEDNADDKMRAMAFFRDAFEDHVRQQPGLWNLWDEIQFKIASDELEKGPAEHAAAQ